MSEMRCLLVRAHRQKMVVIVSFGDKRHRGVSMAIVPSYLAIADLIADLNTMASWSLDVNQNPTLLYSQEVVVRRKPESSPVSPL